MNNSFYLGLAVAQIAVAILPDRALSQGGSPLEFGESGAAEIRPEEIPRSFVGLWGRIECREIMIEAPEWYARRNLESIDWKKGAVWDFGGDVQGVRQFLQEAGLDFETIQRLTTPPVLESDRSPVRIRPPEDLILALPEGARARIYSGIGYNDPTDSFRYPFQLAPGGFPRMAGSHSRLSPSLIDLMTRLSFSGPGGIVYFSDLNLVLNKASSDEERIQIVQFMTREPSEQVWLDLRRSEDRRAEMLSFWDASGKNSAAAEVLESALATPELERLDVLQLLPPVPRRLLNTYPSMEESVGGLFPDCFVTAFSFFADEIPPRMYNSRQEEILEAYEEASPPWRLGDIFVVTGSDGGWKHLCNYVAGEIMFSKNGETPERPWVLQSLEDVLDSYRTEPSVNTLVYRRKELPEE